MEDESKATYPSIRELFIGYSGEYKPSEMKADDGIGRELM